MNMERWQLGIFILILLLLMGFGIFYSSMQSFTSQTSACASNQFVNAITLSPLTLTCSQFPITFRQSADQIVTGITYTSSNTFTFSTLPSTTYFLDFKLYVTVSVASTMFQTKIMVSNLASVGLNSCLEYSTLTTTDIYNTCITASSISGSTCAVVGNTLTPTMATASMQYISIQATITTSSSSGTMLFCFANSVVTDTSTMKTGSFMILYSNV